MEKAIIKSNIKKDMYLNGFKQNVPYEVFAVSGGKIILVDESGELLDLYPTYIRIVNAD